MSSTMLHPAEVDLKRTIDRVMSEIDRLRPHRIVFDSLAELRLLAQDPLRYRRQVVALKQYMASRHCTTMLIDDRSALDDGLQVRSVAHCVISLELENQAYGNDRRRVRVVKYRGVPFRSGTHDYKIARDGLVVFPRLVAADTRHDGSHQRLSSGIPELDAMMGAAWKKA